MKKTVQIVTFHWTINFGGLLQAFSLQETIKNLGYNVEFLNYYNEKQALSNLSLKRLILHKVWTPIKNVLFGGNARLQLTKNFVDKHLCVGKHKCTDLEGAKKVSEHIDCFVTGSDQVWNSDITGNPNVFLLKHAGNKPKISYAASFGKPSIKDNLKAVYASELETFKAISVRENSAVKLIQSIADLKPEVVLDPVFLRTKDEWSSLFNESICQIQQDYILCYYMPTNNKSITNSIARMADKYAREKKCKIINIGKKEYEKLKFWETNLSAVGPAEFVSLIGNAELVITNSFHGTAFSMIMNTPFLVPVDYSVPCDTRLSNRIECLLDDFNLNNRIVDCSTQDYINKKHDEIDFDVVNGLLDVKRKQSIQFLRSNLCD